MCYFENYLKVKVRSVSRSESFFKVRITIKVKIKVKTWSKVTYRNKGKADSTTFVSILSERFVFTCIYDLFRLSLLFYSFFSLSRYRRFPLCSLWKIFSICTKDFAASLYLNVNVAASDYYSKGINKDKQDFINIFSF